MSECDINRTIERFCRQHESTAHDLVGSIAVAASSSQSRKRKHQCDISHGKKQRQRQQNHVDRDVELSARSTSAVDSSRAVSSLSFGSGYLDNVERLRLEQTAATVDRNCISLFRSLTMHLTKLATCLFESCYDEQRRQDDQSTITNNTVLTTTPETTAVLDSVERLHRYTVKTMTRLLLFLRYTHRTFVTIRQPLLKNASITLLGRAALRAIEYTRSLVMDTVHFVIKRAKWPRDDAAFVIRVMRKLLLTIVHTFSEQMLRLCERKLCGRNAHLLTTVANNSNESSADALSLLRCHVCYRTFAKTFHYLQHIRVHYRLNMYLCRYCGDSFVQQNGLDYHVARCCCAILRNHDHNVGDRSDNDERSQRKTIAASNETSSRQTSIVLEMCESCNRFFQHGKTLRNHVLREHAARNIDLGVNRMQQERIEHFLKMKLGLLD